MSDYGKSKAIEYPAERSIEEFERLSGQGNSVGWTFNRDEIHQRVWFAALSG
jgi:hypothetical protein